MYTEERQSHEIYRDTPQGEVVRFYLTNTANTRMFNIRLPGAQMKLVGSDSGQYEHETFVDEILFAQAGRFVLEHHTPERTSVLSEVMEPSPQKEAPRLITGCAKETIRETDSSDRCCYRRSRGMTRPDSVPRCVDGEDHT